MCINMLFLFIRSTNSKIGLAWTIPFQKRKLPTYFGQLNFILGVED